MVSFEGRFTDASSLKVGLVVARFNDLVTNKLLNGCLDCLNRHGIDISESSTQLDVAWVPGSLELPLVCQSLARSGRYQVIIALGAVIRGETPHFEFIANECAAGISRLSVASTTPIIFGVLTVDNKEQAMKRSEEEGNNKGVDAAEAALEMIELFQDI